MSLVMPESKFIARYAFLVTNAIFWGLSLGLVFYMVYYLLVYPAAFNFMIGTVAATYCILVAGLVTFLAGMIGYCTGLRLNKKIFIVYLFLASIVLALSVAGIGYLAYKEMTASPNFPEWYKIEAAAQSMIQSELQCCGLNGPKSLINSTGVLNDPTCFNLTVINGVEWFLPIETGCQTQLTSALSTTRVIVISLLAVIVVCTIVGITSGVNILKRLHSEEEEEDQSKIKGKHKYKFIRGLTIEDDNT